MSFNYKNPISPLSILGNLSVSRTDVFGTNFSVLSTGGYMEVYSLSDLNYSIPSGFTGLIEYSANTIPIQFNKGSGSVFSPDVLTLNSDNISSGRRRLGMLVYVIDQDQIYQYQIPNFTTLWNAATGATGPGGPTVVFSEFGTTVKNNTPQGISFISAWTANTIEGISGETSSTAVWKKLVTGGGGFTGGTVTGATIFTNGLTANTFSASTYLGLPSDIYITGGTFDNNTDTLTLLRSSGSSIVITGFTDYFTTGATLIGDTIYFDRNDSLSAYSVNLSSFTPSVDVHVTGATYDNANTFTFTNNTGGTFDVSFDIVTGLTINGNLNVTGNTIFDNITATTISASTYQNLPIDPDTYVTAFTYSSNTLTIFDNSGNTFSTTINDFTGLTINGDLNVTGDTILNNLTANTISATTYQNLPIGPDTYITAFTYSSNTLTIDDNSGNTFNTTINDFTGLTINGDLTVTGNTNVQGITATTISATTYQGLPIDPDTYVTAFTYNNNTFTIEDNSGTTFNATINDVTGLTINGDLTVTGNTTLQSLTATTISATTYQNLPTDIRVTGGTYTAGTATFTNNTGGTFNVSGFYTGDTDDNTFVTGFTYSSNTFTISDNSGSTFNATINEMTGLTVNGTLSATTISANTIGDVQYIDFDITNTGTTSSPGRLFWDFDNRTLSLGMIGGVTQQIGEEQYYLVENQTGGVLNDGTVVRAVGTTGSSGKLTVNYMIANGTIPAFTTLGVLTQSLSSGDTGYVTSFGLVRNIDTTGIPYGETWSNGTILYVSTTNLGGFTSVKPITPNQDIIIAIVMEAAVNGSIFVRPDVYRPFKDPQRITVAKQNGDFTSVKDAVDSITGSSSSNRYVIDIGPGEFYEGEIDMTNTPYVSLVGSNIQTTLLIPTGSTQHIVKIGINNEISFLSFSGAGSGYAAIYCDDIGDFAQAHKCSFYECDTNVWVKSSTQDTKFYGEYLDYNGTYTYGTKVESTGGYLALANMENYFNFPTGSNITYCNYVTGSGATLSVFVGDNQSNGVSGSTAYYVRDGAGLYCSTITVDGFTYGIWNPNIGLPIRFDVDNASFVDGEWDLYIERLNTFGTFGGSSNHEKIFSVSDDVYWAFLDIQDGEFDITRKASVTFTDGSHTDFTTLIFEGGSMGLMTGGTLTTISGTTVQADGGFGYVEKSDDSGIVRRIDWSSTTITLSADSQNYIFINENGILGSSGSRPISDFNIILGRVVTDSTGVEFIDLSPFDAEHTSNKYNNLFSNALGPIYANGSIVTEGTTAFTLDVSAGEYYFSTNEFTPTGGTPITFSQYYRNGTGSTWVVSSTTVVNNTQYDNNGTLTGLTSGYYTKHTLYVLGESSYERYFLVLGQNEYSTLVQAEGGLLPTPPTYFSDAVTQIASIYIQEGTSGITQIEDIRPVIGFKSGGVNASSVHGNLLGLAADDHTQYLLVNGGRAMSGNLDMGGNNIVSAGTINGVTIESHAIRHQFAGADPVGTVTPSANAIPYADVSGKLDSWISTATTSTLGLVKVSVNPVSSSNPIVVGENDNRFLKSFTGGSYSDSTKTLTFTTVDGTSYPITGFVNTYLTAFTYNNNTFTISDSSGNTLNATFNNVTGLTVNGDLTVTGNTSLQNVTATTISATTYQNLPTDIRVTGGTYTAGTATFTNNTGGTFTVTGFTSQDTFTTAFTYSNNTFTIFRNQGQPDLTATINTMTGLTVNGNLIVTGNTNVQALTGTSAYLSGSGQNILTIVGSGSSTSSPLMVVSGSSGELFSITDSLVGTLFSVNNLSGNPILSVDSSDIILMGNYLSPSLNSTIKVSASTGTTNIYSIPTSAYTGAFFDYTVNDGTNLRAGNIMSIWSGSTIQYSETSTTDIGNTSGITFNLTISSGNAILRTSGTTSGWTVKTIIRSI